MSEQLVEELRSRLLAIQITSLLIPKQKDNPELSIDNFSICSRSRRFSHFAYSLFNDGLGITWTTDEFLEHRSHRLSIPRVGDGFRYHREPFDVDCQAIGSRRIDAMGISEIAPVVETKYIDAIQTETWEASKLGWNGLVLVTTRTVDC